MKLRNRQTGREINISPERWEQLKRSWSQRYEVVKEQPVIERIEVKKEISREEMIQQLKEKGFRIPSNIKDETLKLKYERSI
jgi:hypothetical protein